MSDTKTKVISIIADHLGHEDTQVTEEKSLKDDLGADSLDTVELVMALEVEFDIEIVDETAEQILTVGDAIKAVESNIKAKAAA